jgi:hypothetical protein
MLVMGMQLPKRDLRDFTRRDYDDALTVFHNEQRVDVMFGSGDNIEIVLRRVVDNFRYCLGAGRHCPSHDRARCHGCLG